ncbi:hypothetical protein Syun_024391 [Stephania yunnanensis]|uniref:Uncharacterized protein n=1 Tax=Stephania yunnanensis TaxID=152371 RepID=A0AAP0I4A0_9MAGN
MGLGCPANMGLGQPSPWPAGPTCRPLLLQIVAETIFFPFSFCLFVSLSTTTTITPPPKT